MHCKINMATMCDFVPLNFVYVRIGNGSWVTTGVMTTNIMAPSADSDAGHLTTVRCSSTHLTSFVVLVDVAGGSQVS